MLLLTSCDDQARRLLECIELRDRANARHARRMLGLDDKDHAIPRPASFVQITASQDARSTAKSCNARINPTIRGG